MTGSESGQHTHTAEPLVIDGKYEVLRVIDQSGNLTVYEVRSGEGLIRKVSWFDISSSPDRQNFHDYRTALRAIAPAGMTDIVARPGAYYVVWQAISGTPFTDYLNQGVKKQEGIDGVEALSDKLLSQGFSLSDADIFIDGQSPKIAYLAPVPRRSPDEIASLNASVMAGLRGGKVKTKRKLASTKPSLPLGLISFIPGVFMLAGAAYFGTQAAEVYLNPPNAEVANVEGRPAKEAAEALIKRGFRVEYSYGDSGTVAVGSVIRQEPAAGIGLPVGRMVILTVNKPQPLIVPKIEDLTPEQAKSPLKDNILKMGKALKVDGTLSNTPEGRIIAQSPSPGEAIQRGQNVQVLISSGVRGKETWIANLEGLTYEQAREHARSAGLVVTDVKTEASERQENTVLRQDPAPFVRVAVGSQVRLVIAASKYTPPSTPAGSLPIPPAYVPPPPPVVPDEPAATDPQTVPDPVVPTPDPATPAATERTVSFNYTFPQNIPAGNYSVVVQDLDGEREIMPATHSDQIAGMNANAPVTVRGDAVFIIRFNGAEYTRVVP